MTLYIHIGFGKTGTTAIQDFFFENRDTLLRSGLLYPENGLSGTGHHKLAILEQKTPPVEVERQCQILRHLVNANSTHSTLISSENFCFMYPSYIQRIASLLQGCEVKIIFYIRSQPHLIESTFLEAQKVGRDHLGTVEKFFSVHHASFDFLTRIKPWAEAFGEENIQARLYDKRVFGTDIRTDFLRFIGMAEVIEVGKYQTSNGSLISDFSNLANIFDDSHPRAGSRQLFINELLTLSQRFKAHASKPLIDDEFKARIIEIYKDSNAEFAKRFLGSEQGRLLCQQP